jgi:carboxypeptidase family protein/TonB-dependent receptor-like protein
MNIRRAAATVFTAVAAVSVPVAAQTSSGVIEGTVTDVSGGVLPGVTVTARADSTGFIRSVATGAQGAYRLNELPPASYSVRFELAGFKPAEQSDVVLTIGSDVTLPVQLQVGSVQESVTVSRALLVEATEKAVTTNITPTEVDALPLLGRRFVDLAALAPGVTRDYASVTSPTDSIAFAGLSENYKSLWFEGVDIGDEATGGGTNLSDSSRLNIPQEAVQEFQVMSTQYSAEFGRSATGVINVLGKAGTNEWLGRGYYFRRGDGLDKPNAFASGKTPYRQHLFGGSVGGPVVKDRMHFFGTYDGQSLHNVVTYTIPNFLQPFLPAFDNIAEAPQPSNAHNVYGKLTWSLSRNQYLSVSTLGGRSQQALAGTGGAVAADAGYTNISKDLYVATALTSVLSSQWTHVLRLAWSDVVTDRPASGPAGITMTFPSFTFGERSNYPQNRVQKNYIAMSAASYHRETSRFGTHDVKFGASANLTTGSYTEERGFNGAYVFLEDKLPVPGVPSTYPATFSIRTGSGTVENRDVNVFGFYAEDKLALRPGLTVTAGLRYDPQFWRGELAGQPIPTDIPIEQFWARFVAGDLKGTNYRAVPTDLKTFGPRVGVAWAPVNDAKTVVRAGWGIFNAFITTRFPTSAIGTYPDFLSSAFGNDVRITGIPNLAFPDRMPMSALSKTGSASVSVPVPASLARFPSTQQFTMGMERQIAESTVVSVSYSRILGRNLQRSYNVNSRRSDGTYPVLPSGIILNVSAWDATSRTNQFQVQLTRRLRNNLSLDASYSWMRAFGLDAPVDANNPYSMDNWGPTVNDIRHRFVGNAVYRLPLDIQVGAVVTAASAPPYNIITGTDDNKDRNINDRPIVNGVMLPPNAGRGNSYFDADLRLGKLVRVAGRRLELMFEMFNLFNTVNYGNYIGNQKSVNFGQPTVALAPFQGQLGVRLDF